MSADQTRTICNQLSKEIADLEKKLADEVKKEADKMKRINDTQKSINKYTSESTRQSKVRQIQSCQDDLTRIAKKKADINNKIADKRKRHSDTTIKLHKEEALENKKAQQIQKSIYDNYEKQIANLTSQLKTQVIVPTSLYAQDSNLEEQYDVFISHASEDKETFVNELVDELKSLGVKVWYDALIIKWGDSLRTKIDDGLRKSKYGIVVISKDYIKKFWTNVELDGLFQIESTNGKTILPIWHNISKKEVQGFSPTIAGKLALNTTMMNPQEIAKELLNILGIEQIQEVKTNGQA